ncbi:hypothetical protein RRG08_057116 [Elysia crispata]|uniref:Uncharacterized protein n=1 Tax=Elysia crispata TaxID=231223 RepID=A0AAE1AF73_9GAST|nr:hypothetical protein RRG08_057116 [Elysia crispata]
MQKMQKKKPTTPSLKLRLDSKLISGPSVHLTCLPLMSIRINHRVQSSKSDKLPGRGRRRAPYKRPLVQPRQQYLNLTDFVAVHRHEWRRLHLATALLPSPPPLLLPPPRCYFLYDTNPSPPPPPKALRPKNMGITSQPLPPLPKPHSPPPDFPSWEETTASARSPRVESRSLAT